MSETSRCTKNPKMNSETQTNLPYPDVYYLSAAQGWLELGNAGEALRELERMCFHSLAQNEALAVRWKVFAALGRWDRSLEIARAIVRAGSERPTGWICLAFSLINTRGAAAASQSLLDAAIELPETSRSVPNFLARQTERMAASPDPNRWLRKWEAMEAQLLQAQRKQTETKEVATEAPEPVPAGPATDDNFAEPGSGRVSL